MWSNGATRVSRAPAVRALVLVAAALGLALALAATYGGGGRSSAVPPPGLPVIVADGAGAARWVALLRASGAAARVGSVADGIARGKLVVPGDAAVDPADLRTFVARGGRLVVSSPPLLRSLGFRLAPETSLGGVVEDGHADAVRWPAPLAVRPLRTSPSLRGFRPLAAAGSTIVSATAAVGRGRVLALALDPLAAGRTGWEVLPSLGRAAAALLAAPPGPERPAVELYFDPEVLRIAPAELARRADGARAVLVAGWNVGSDDPAADFDYAAAIAALHARGIRVYAWLEPPLVTRALWNGHPECRERDSAGNDAVDDWRPLVALEDDRCFELAWKVWSGLLTRYDFDGVDVAELYYRSPSLPYSQAALEQFGGDPAADPRRWLDFREQLVARLNAEIVDRIRMLDERLDVELTVIDDRLDPQLAAQVGSDVDALAAVARRTGATLQVEDPYTTWTRGPTRYAQLSRRLAPLLPAGRLFFDINVVAREYEYPTPTMRGAELDLSVANAGRAAGRVALYSAASVSAADAVRAAAALGAAASTGDGTVSAPWTVVVRTPRPALARLELDGSPWPSAHGTAVVPAGRHTLVWRPGRETRPAVLRLAGELLEQRATRATLTLRYDADATAWTVVDRLPAAVRVDGTRVDVGATPDPDGGVVLRLPTGRHRVDLSFAPVREALATALPRCAAGRHLAPAAPPAGGAYAGAFPFFSDARRNEDAVSRARLDRFARLAGRPLAWAAFSNHWLGGRIRYPAAAVATVWAAGALPVVRMLPWSRQRENAPDPLFTTAGIARGRWDAQLGRWADDARAAGIPLMLDFAPEMNGDWFPWSGVYSGGGVAGAHAYRAAFRHVVELFRRRGARNVSFAFHVDGGDTRLLRAYYPGSAYVDWVGASAYGADDPAYPWLAFAQALGPSYRALRALAPQKPFAVFEWGVVEAPSRGDKAGWIRNAFAALAASFPDVRAVSWWDERWQTDDGRWSDTRIDSSPAALAAYRRGIAAPRYEARLRLVCAADR